METSWTSIIEKLGEGVGKGGVSSAESVGKIVPDVQGVWGTCRQ